MLLFLKKILDIFLFRGHPKDLPGGVNYLLAAAVLALIGRTLFTASTNSAASISLLIHAGSLAIFGGLVWLALHAMSKSARWQQTMTAVYGVEGIICLITIPFSKAMNLQFVNNAEYTVDSGGATLIVLVLLLWFWIVTAQIFKLASETKMLRSIITVTILMLMTNLLVKLLFSGMLPDPTPSTL